MPREAYNELYGLLGALREGIITPEQEQRLAQLLEEDAEAQQRYVEYLVCCSDLRDIVSSCPADLEAATSHEIPDQVSEKVDTDAFSSLCNEPQESETDPEEIRKRAERAYEQFKLDERRQAEEHACKAFQIRRRRLIVSISGMAALLGILVWTWVANLQQPDPTDQRVAVTIEPPLVATIGKTMAARWADANLPTVVGSRLTASTLTLEEGLVELQLDQGAQLVLQAPCQVRLDNAEKVFLQRGKLCALVPPPAIGFQVETNEGLITDYGTEFAVASGFRGRTFTHVYEGRIGLKSQQQLQADPLMLTQGKAGVAPAQGPVREISFRGRQFIRRIPDRLPVGIPGKRLDLADIIGGGNGFGTGEIGGHNKSAKGTINVVTGLANDPTHPKASRTHRVQGAPTNRYDTWCLSGDATYQPVQDVLGVDGVFVPDRSNGPCVVSSKGHVFTECPDTDGQFQWHIHNGWRHRNHADDTAFIRDEEGLSQTTCVSMRANLGITFDLRKIRNELAGKPLAEFTAQAGIPISLQPELAYAEIWVLVDGTVRSSQKVHYKQIVDIKVSLQASDRFFTLITTDGGRRPTDTDEAQSDHDWCVFIEPALTLQ